MPIPKRSHPGGDGCRGERRGKDSYVPKQEITINAPAEKVFAYLADITRHREWSKGEHKLQVEKTSEGPIGQGATFRSVGYQFGRNEDTVTITEYVPSQRIVFQANGRVGLARHAFEIAPTDGAVRVTKSFDIVNGEFPFTIMYPLVARRFYWPGALKGDLERIKAKLERT